MKTKILKIALVAVALFVGGRALAWENIGHAVIAYNAERLLDPEVKAKCRHYLKASIPFYATWMDQARSIEPYTVCDKWHSTNIDAKNKVVNEAIIEISKAVQRMSDSKTGSLIVMEKELLLGDVIKTGIAIDAVVTHELVGNIFYPNTPLHDGAAIVRNGKLLCAGCVLPLTKNDGISSDLGTRHRAALGMSEQSDAIVVVTSEETGIISVAIGGELIRNLTEAELREKLINHLIDDRKESKITGEDGVLKKIFKGKKK